MRVSHCLSSNLLCTMRRSSHRSGNSVVPLQDSVCATSPKSTLFLPRMSLLAASLYLLCLAFLFGSALYVYSRDPFARLNAWYALLALALLGWVGTLFVFTIQMQGPGLLWLGRANFAFAALAAPCAYAFVLALAQRPFRHARWLWAETLLLAAVSLLTPWVDRAETIGVGQHVSTYGAVFPLYLLHIVAFAVAAVFVAFRTSGSLPTQTRIQLRLVGAGILLTVLTGFVTNAALPYFYGNFRFINIGTLSTIFFLIVVAYAACVHHLFNVRVLVKRTVVFALLIAFALELYQAAVGALALLLPLGDVAQRHVAATAIALIINAVTQQPLRWWLERLADKLLAGRHPHPGHTGRAARL